MKLIFFDLDHTLLRSSTGVHIMKEYSRRGQLKKSDAVRGLWFGLLHYLDLASIEEMMRKAARMYAGMSELEISEHMKEMFNVAVRHNFYEESLELLQEHRQAGDSVWIISASTDYIVQPIAQQLGVHGVGSKQIVDQGRITENPAAPIPYGQGKITIADEIRQQHNVEWENCWFYSDSHSDWPLLERVGKAIAVNPDPRLKRKFGQRGWQMVRATKTTELPALELNC